MTRAQTTFEQIAIAFRLHAQRIAECVSEFDPSGFDAWRNSAADWDARWALYEAFDWSRTIKGAGYWFTLADGARQS